MHGYAAGWRPDAGAGAGNVVTDVEVNLRSAGTWGPIDLGKIYTVVTNSYIATGRDGYTAFAEIDETLITDTYNTDVQALIDYSDSVGVLQDLPSDEYSTKLFSQ